MSGAKPKLLVVGAPGYRRGGNLRCLRSIKEYSKFFDVYLMTPLNHLPELLKEKILEKLTSYNVRLVGYFHNSLITRVPPLENFITNYVVPSIFPEVYSIHLSLRSDARKRDARKGGFVAYFALCRSGKLSAGRLPPCTSPLTAAPDKLLDHLLRLAGELLRALRAWSYLSRCTEVTASSQLAGSPWAAKKSASYSPSSMCARRRRPP